MHSPGCEHAAGETTCMSDPAHSSGGETGNEGEQCGSVQPERHKAQENRENPFFQPTDQEEITKQAVHNPGQTMADCRPEQSNGYFKNDHRCPDSEVVPRSSRQDQPAERKKNDAVGDEMGEAGMTEGCGEDPPERLILSHRQIPLPPEDDLVEELLNPGDGKEQQRNQETPAQLSSAMTTMMTYAGVGN